MIITRKKDLVYTSGQLPIDPSTGIFAEGAIKEQARQSLLNVKAILEAAGLTLSHVLKTTVFLVDKLTSKQVDKLTPETTDMNDSSEMNSVHA